MAPKKVFTTLAALAVGTVIAGSQAAPALADDHPPGGTKKEGTAQCGAGKCGASPAAKHADGEKHCSSKDMKCSAEKKAEADKHCSGEKKCGADNKSCSGAKK